MAFQLSDIRTKVQLRVRDTGYSTIEITNYLNDTLNDIYNEYRMPFMEARQAYTTVANVGDITNGAGLPTNYSQAVDLYVTATHEVIPYVSVPATDEQIFEAPSTITGVAGLSWGLFANTPFLIPAPSVSYNVTLRYYKMPTLLVADGDIPALPSSFEEVLVMGASYRVMQVKDNYDQAAILQNKYDEILQKLVSRTTQRQVGQAVQMRLNKYPVSKTSF